LQHTQYNYATMKFVFLLVIVEIYFIALSSGELSPQYIQVHIRSGASFSVKDFGATGDGKTLDTDAIQATFDAAGKAGGGTVLFPTGTYYTFPFHFSGSGTKMSLATGAIILASNDKAHWPGAPSNPTHFITASKYNNLEINGNGTIDGNGAVWWTDKSSPRPNLVYFSGTTNVHFSGVTFQNSPDHTLELFSDHTELSNIKIEAPASSPNTDGVDVHGQPFYIHDSIINVGDDNVAVHASNLLVDKCKFGSGHGASIGSIGSGIYANITFRNISFDETVQAIRIKTIPGATGSITNVVYEDITLKNVGEAFVIDMYYDKQPEKQTTMEISNIKFSNIKGSVTKDAGSLMCQPSSPCKAISFNGVNLTPASTLWTCSNISGTQSNVSPPTCVKSL